MGGDELASVPPRAVPLLYLLVSLTPDSVQLSAMTLAELGCSDVDAATVITLDVPLFPPLLLLAPGHSLPIPFAEDVSDFHNSCAVSAKICSPSAPTIYCTQVMFSSSFLFSLACGLQCILPIGLVAALFSLANFIYVSWHCFVGFL